MPGNAKQHHPGKTYGWLCIGVVCLVLVMFIMTHNPRFGHLPPMWRGGDGSLHFIGYGILGLVVTLVHYNGWGQASLNFTATVGRWLVISLYGLFDELTQPIVNRGCQYSDYIADVSGAALGIAIGTLVVHLYKRRQKART